MMDDAGYVRLWRKITDNPVWTTLKPGVLKVALAFLIQANWKPETWYDCRSEVEIPRGSFVTSYPKMAAFCNLTAKQIRTAFAHLEKLHFAAYNEGIDRAQPRAQWGAQSRAQHWTMVTVLNYDSYQASLTHEGTAEDTAEGSQSVRSRAPTKEERNKKVNTCASPDERSNGLPSMDRLPFDTLELPEVPAKPAWGVAEKKGAFEEFWKVWPRNVAKVAAEKAFSKCATSPELADRIINAISAQLPQLTKDLQYCPYPATWLNQKRYEDEPGDPQPPAGRLMA